MFESEEDRIAERIKDFIKKSKKYFSGVLIYIMLRDGRILVTRDYFGMVRSDKVNPQDAYTYIRIRWAPSKSSFHYLFLGWYEDFLDAYISKLGFRYGNYVVPATGLKYVTHAAIDFDTGRYLSIEVTNLDIVVTNTNLPKIVFEAAGDKIISGKKELTDEEYKKILDMYKSQRLIAGYNFSEADGIIYNYYDRDNKSLVKEVARITMDYDRIFQPYRTCYDMETWKEIDCWSIKLD